MDIQNCVQLTVQDREVLLQRLIDLSDQGQRKELAEAESVLTEGTGRLEKADMLACKLFEEKCRGNVPDIIFKKLMLNYKQEKR